MNESDVLLTLAEIAVVFAGFASLATLFGQRRSGEALAVDAMRMLNMLAVSLSVLGLSLAPLIFIAMGLEDQSVWQYSAIAALPIWGLVCIFVVKRARRTQSIKGFSRSSSIINSALSVIASLLLAAAMLGLPAENNFLPYFAALLAMLAVCAILFFNLIGSLFST